MADDINDVALDHMLAHAGLTPSTAQKSALKPYYAKIAAMAASVRAPRGHMAEPAHLYVLPGDNHP